MDIWYLRKNTILIKVFVAEWGAYIVLITMKMFPSRAVQCFIPQRINDPADFSANVEVCFGVKPLARRLHNIYIKFRPMKKMLIVFAVSLLAIKGISQQKQLKDLVGRWEVASNQKNAACLEVIDSSNIILSYNGEKIKLTDYKIDFTKSPIWFDFSTGTGDSAVLVKSLIEVVNDTMIKWQLFVDEERTPQFSSTKGELFFLKRSKDPAVTSVVAN
jgi:hypothetical protein